MEGISNAEAAEHKIGGPKHIDTIRQKQNEENGVKSDKGCGEKKDSSSVSISVGEKKDIAITVDDDDDDDDDDSDIDEQQPSQPLQPQPPQPCQQPQPQLIQRQEDRYPEVPSDVERRLTPPATPLVAMVTPSPLLPIHPSHNGCVVSSPESQDHSVSNDHIDVMDVASSNHTSSAAPAPLCTSLSSCESSAAIMESSVSSELRPMSSHSPDHPVAAPVAVDDSI